MEILLSGIQTTRRKLLSSGLRFCATQPLSATRKLVVKRKCLSRYLEEAAEAVEEMTKKPWKRWHLLFGCWWKSKQAFHIFVFTYLYEFVHIVDLEFWIKIDLLLLHFKTLTHTHGKSVPCVCVCACAKFCHHAVVVARGCPRGCPRCSFDSCRKILRRRLSL